MKQQIDNNRPWMDPTIVARREADPVWINRREIFPQEKLDLYLHAERWSDPAPD